MNSQESPVKLHWFVCWLSTETADVYQTTVESLASSAHLVGSCDAWKASRAHQYRSQRTLADTVLRLPVLRDVRLPDLSTSDRTRQSCSDCTGFGGAVAT